MGIHTSFMEYPSFYCINRLGEILVKANIQTISIPKTLYAQYPGIPLFRLLGFKMENKYFSCQYNVNMCFTHSYLLGTIPQKK